MTPTATKSYMNVTLKQARKSLLKEDRFISIYFRDETSKA